MKSNFIPARPALIAEQPALVREALRSYGIAVRMLVLDEEPGITTIPPTPAPLIFDLRGATIGATARRLGALRQYQRRTRLIPHLIVESDDYTTQQLIASCADLRAAILDANQPETLVTWLWAPLDLAPSQLWVNVPKPLARQHPYCTQLIAALDGAVSVEQAAVRCAIAPNTAYSILHLCCGKSSIRRSVQAWREAMVAALSG